MTAANDDEDLRFGGCPHCHGVDEHFNVQRDHFAACHQHRVMWNFGANLFFSWRNETEADWEGNTRRFAGYRWVDPHYDVKQPLEPLGGDAA